MYFIKNGKKVKYNPQTIPQKPKENFSLTVKEKYKNGNGKNCPSWVFIVLGVIAILIAIWIVLSIIKDKKQ